MTLENKSKIEDGSKINKMKSRWVLEKMEIFLQKQEPEFRILLK